jgi:hypothetical protein
VEGHRKVPVLVENIRVGKNTCQVYAEYFLEQILIIKCCKLDCFLAETIFCIFILNDLAYENRIDSSCLHQVQKFQLFLKNRGVGHLLVKNHLADRYFDGATTLGITSLSIITFSITINKT